LSKDIKNKIASIPASPGVYFFKDKKQQIIYIGKAKSLKKRVSSYFSKNNHDIKTSVMVNHIYDIDFLIVRDEAEALISESNLIKINKPRYNVYLKDDKTFPYIKITKEPYPKVEIVRLKNFNKDNHLYFGPYTRTRDLRNILNVLHKIFSIRTCNYFIDQKFIEQKKIKVCLDYHLKRCDGPCEGLISEVKYAKIIKQASYFLKGNTEKVVKYLKEKMNISSAKMEYEKAAALRDQVMLIKDFYKTETHHLTNTINRDILGVSNEGNIGIVTMIKYRNSKLIGKETFEINTSDNTNENVVGFIKQYYLSTFDIPKEIVVQDNMVDQSDISSLMEALNKKMPKILVPIRGEKKKILDICIKNSEAQLIRILSKKTRRKEFVSKMVTALQDDLVLDVPPRRIEGFDNSNIQGSYPVSSMVCFIDGKPRKGEYRKFKIKDVKGIDDFASMREVVTRRYKRVIKEKTPLPDLILVDGGKGQLSSAKSALDSLGLSFIPIIGLAKKMEEVFKPQYLEAQSISKTSPGLVLLKQIRDESHRFAITFHRQLREKGMFK
jgi:excinuclease ABC subunit C